MLNVISLGEVDYQLCLENMKRRVKELASINSVGEIWHVQHPKVYTLGVRGNEHIDLLNNPYNIPVVKTNRGGRITYHGPGQDIFYPLCSLEKLQLTIKSLVYLLEQSVIQILSGLNVKASRIDSRPGVYIETSKIASVGLRIYKNYSYHGLSFNNTVPLEPFSCINPCGYKDQKVTNLLKLDKYELNIADALAQKIAYNLTYHGKNYSKN